MAEEVETQPGGSEGAREGFRELREDVSREKLESRLDEAVSDRPVLKYLLDLRIVGRALLIAAVLTLIVSLLLSPKLGALVLVVSFFAIWFGTGIRQYNRRRPTKPVDTESDDDSE